LITALVAEQVRSRIALLGNAAHSLHPVAGQGFNLALRDAASLASTMGRARAGGQDFSSIRVLERYRLAQSADQQRVLALTRGLPAMFTPRSPGLVAGRNVALILMNVAAPLRRRFAHLGMGHLQADLDV
jgi:2-octaprenyl-6-methoxyphenol hydroxylase